MVFFIELQEFAPFWKKVETRKFWPRFEATWDLQRISFFVTEFGLNKYTPKNILDGKRKKEFLILIQNLLVGQQELVEVSGVGELWGRVSDEPEGGPGRVDGDAGVADLMRGPEGWRPVEEVSRVVPVVVVGVKLVVGKVVA